ncbi:conserved exported hypothetical protein [Candidatus Sulfopaludibacter sp. SbA3]|nr:conserved exported hypothetical protein [Candidatus Sulfopaludibacter sp. SbA3]
MRLVTLALIAASVSFAAAPDFTGTWKLNPAKSDFGPFPAPSSMTQKVSHAEPKLAVEVKMAGDQGEFEFKQSYTTDGKECVNQGFGGSESKSVLKWDSDTLVIDTKGAFGDNAYTMKDKWSLSEGGKVLTILRHFSGGMGDTDQRIVFDKQ